jgi:dTDP-glucose 4,6-dehydratase
VVKVLITGAAGFLGSHLADRFLAEGHQVIGVDNFITGSPDNLAHLLGRADFTFVQHDVTNYTYVEGPLDGVLHFASPASPIDYLDLPIQTLKVGSLGTHKALGLAKAKGARFLLASTSEVYGDPQVHPQPETYWGHVNPVGPRSVYDEAKRYAEALVMAYHRTHGLDTRIIRIFNTYGPRMKLNDGRVVPTLIHQMLTGRPLTVFGNGSQTRSFCYVSDLVEGICRLAEAPDSPEIHSPMNVGNPSEMSILRFAEAIAALGGQGTKIEFRPLPEDDPKQRQPDIARARQILGWSPCVPLEEGLRITVDYFRKIL